MHRSSPLIFKRLRYDWNGQQTYLLKRHGKPLYIIITVFEDFPQQFLKVLYQSNLKTFGHSAIYHVSEKFFIKAKLYEIL